MKHVVRIVVTFSSPIFRSLSRKIIPPLGGDEGSGSTSESGEGPIKDEEEESSGNYFVTETESSYNGYGVDYSTIKYQGQ